MTQAQPSSCGGGLAHSISSSPSGQSMAPSHTYALGNPPVGVTEWSVYFGICN